MPTRRWPAFGDFGRPSVPTSTTTLPGPMRRWEAVIGDPALAAIHER